MNEELEKKLAELYFEIEGNRPPATFSNADAQWNEGFYRGHLKAIEAVSLRLFGKTGDELEGNNSQ